MRRPPRRRSAMSRLPRHLTAGLLCGLLWATSTSTLARELRPAEPLRVTLVSLARQATPSASAPGSKLSVRRAWASDTQAQLCALTLDAQGQPVLDKGRFQLRRVQFERHQAAWRVQRIDTTWLAADASLDAACPRARDERDTPGPDAPPTHVAKRAPAGIDVALAEMARNPPTAGLPGGRPADAARGTAHCEGTTAPSAPADTATAAWPAGQIGPAGRSALFTAPNNACPMGKHLVQNDKVRIGATSKGWTQVSYTHPITNVVTVGWLPGQKVMTSEAQVASAAH